MKQKTQELVLFGNRIKELRKKNKLTQAQLAELIDISTNYVGMIERGERKTKTEKIFQFAKIFNISMEEFFKGL